MKVTNLFVREVRSCCHHGHGASIFADGTAIQAINRNDVIAKSRIPNGWDYRIAYVNNPNITRSELQEIFDRYDWEIAHHI